MEAIGLSGLIPRFHLQSERQKNSPELIAIFDKVFAEKTLPEWRKVLDDAGITFGVVGTLDDIAEDEQARHAGAIVRIADGSAETVSSPFQVDGEIKRAPDAAPGIGQHTDEILREYGYTAADITRLREAKAVA
jgi:formyl-CoA transferase